MKDALAPVTEAVPPLAEDVLAPVQGILTPADPQAPAAEPPAPVQGALEAVDDVLDGVAPGPGLDSLLPAEPRRAGSPQRLTESPDVRPRALLVVLVAGVALAAAPAAAADLADETALAEKYAPVVRLVEQPEECGPGEPYIPTDVDVLFGDPTVALRGPWNAFDLVKIGPRADDLAGLYEYHLDFPGNALDPGCTYELWARRLTEGSEPAVYAHVVSEPAYAGKVALQYWFFYPFNDFNNTHEGDWEMIQLVFDADDARSALATEPTSVGYSSHEGAERSDWTDEEKLDRVGTHPVVYPAAGSHANKFTAALYVGSSADAGVGCDDTRGPHRELRPSVKTIPSDAAAAGEAFPWITFEGRWGELQKAFYNGPTGPNLKTQWTTPIEWSEGWRDRSYAVPTGGPPRHERDGPVLLGCRGGVAGAHQAREQPVADDPPHRGPARAPGVRRDPRDLDADGAAPHRAPPELRTDPLGLGADVREAAPTVPRDRAPHAPDRADHRGAAVARDRGARPRRRR